MMAARIDMGRSPSGRCIHMDETNPEVRDPELICMPLSPPFSDDFGRYRAAQIARNRKITAWVKDN